MPYGGSIFSILICSALRGLHLFNSYLLCLTGASSFQFSSALPYGGSIFSIRICSALRELHLFNSHQLCLTGVPSFQFLSALPYGGSIFSILICSALRGLHLFNTVLPHLSLRSHRNIARTSNLVRAIECPTKLIFSF